MNYQVVPVTPELAGEVREKMRSPQYGHPAFADLAKGYGPCRVCLETFVRDAEERILFTYNAFENLSALPQPGPIYIHRRDCASFRGAGFPPALVGLPLLFEAFGDESVLVVREKMDAARIDAQLAALLALDSVRFVSVRNAEAGCFVARIDRA